MVLKENNEPKETETDLGQWASFTRDWMSPLRPNGGARGRSSAAGRGVAPFVKHRFSILHLLLPPSEKAQARQRRRTKSLLSSPFVCLEEGETAREACDYPPGCFEAREQWCLFDKAWAILIWRSILVSHPQSTFWRRWLAGSGQQKLSGFYEPHVKLKTALRPPTITHQPRSTLTLQLCKCVIFPAGGRWGSGIKLKGQRLYLNTGSDPLANIMHNCVPDWPHSVQKVVWEMNYLPLNRSSIIIAVNSTAGAVLIKINKQTYLFWTSLSQLQGRISCRAARQERKVPEKGATQLCFCPQLPLSEILELSMRFTQVLLMHWESSPHRALIVPKAVGRKATMDMQFESRSCLKRSSYSGWFERASLDVLELLNSEAKSTAAIVSSDEAWWCTIN